MILLRAIARQAELNLVKLGKTCDGARERAADPAAPEAYAVDEASHGPDAVVGLAL